MDVFPILEAGVAQDTARRNEAERAFQQLEETNPALFFVSLSGALADASRPSNVRSLAGLIFKNALWAQDEIVADKKAKRWNDQAPELKVQVKQSLTNALVTADEDSRRAAAQAISKVALVEKGALGWPELLPGLLSHASSPVLGLPEKATVLLCMGYVCFELSPPQISPEHVVHLLVCLTNAMSERAPPEIRRAGAASLLQALSFAASSFKDENKVQRDAIMAAICTGTKADDLVTRKNSFDCVCKVAELYYGHLRDYMVTLYQLTLAAVRDPNEDIGVRALEFWNTVAEVEVAIEAGYFPGPHMRYVEGAIKDLVPLVTTVMTKQHDDYDTDNFTLAMAGSTCLALIAQDTKDKCLQPVAEFVRTSFESPDWHFRDAATMALGSILEGPDPSSLKGFVEFFLPFLMNRLSKQATPAGGAAHIEPDVNVRDTSAWTIGKILALQYDLVKKELLPQLVEVLKAALQDAPRVALNVCFAINQLSTAMAEAGESINLSPQVHPLLTALVGCCMREDWDEDNLRESCFTCMATILDNADDKDLPVVEGFLNYCLQWLETSLATPLATADLRVEHHGLQAHLCGVVHSAINRSAEASMRCADRIVKDMSQLFEAKATGALEEAFTCLGALANHIEEHYGKYVEFLDKYFTAGLQQYAEYEVCIAAVQALGDVCRSVGPAINPKCDGYMRLILSALQKADLNRNLKPPMVAVFGDIAMALGRDFHRFITFAMSAIGGAMTIKAPPADEDLVEFVETLRVAVLEAFTGIVHGYVEHDRTCVDSQLRGLAQYLCDFVNELRDTTADDRTIGSTPKIIKMATGLMGDLARELGPAKVHSVMSVHMEWVQKLLQWTMELERAEVEAGELKPENAIASWVPQYLTPTGGTVVPPPGP